MADLGLLILVTWLSATAARADEREDIKSLNEVGSLQVFGDLITIVAKNDTEPETKDGDDPFDDYLRSHVIRIKAPEEKHLDFELDDLIPGDEVEGREKRRKGPIREILIPLLLAIKHKATVVLPIFMTIVTIVALKGFWAGMSGLVISKVVGLKVLLQSLEKPEKDQEEDQDDYHDHDNSQNDDEGHEENEEPVVIYLHPHGHRRISKRHESWRTVNRYHGPKGWNPLGRRRQSQKKKTGAVVF